MTGSAIAHFEILEELMEYVRGRTLADLIPRKGMPVAKALRYAVQIADALSAEHEAGIVHRDLKPGNVMVTDKGLVKVVDFGLARLTDPTTPGPDEATLTEKAVIEPGIAVGTAAYMTPEQAEGRPVDARADIFSSLARDPGQGGCRPCGVARRAVSDLATVGQADLRSDAGRELPLTTARTVNKS